MIKTFSFYLLKTFSFYHSIIVPILRLAFIGVRMKKIILIFAAVLFFISCAKPGPKSEEGKPVEKEAGESIETVFAINTTKAVRGEILDYIELNGDVVTKTSVDIFADTIGKLVKINVSLGDYVKKDQVIAEVDPSRPGMTFANSPVKSHISGTIISVHAQIGATITQAVPIAKISKMDQIEIKTKVSERYISKMKVGLDAMLHFEAYPDKHFSARISELSPVVDSVSRTMEVRLNLEKNDGSIKVGMFAEVKIITEKKKSVVKIPADCLVKRYGGYYVFVVSDSQVEKRKVTPGIQIDDKLEIVEGLEADEVIVILGQTLLEDKAKIRIVEQIQPLEQKDVVE